MKPIEVRLTGRFKFRSKLEGDHEMMLFRGVHMQTNESLIMKGEEHKATKVRKHSLTLLQEGKIYQALQGGPGIPYMHWCGQEEDYNFLVLEELDSTLGDLLQRCGSKLSLKSALMLTGDLLSILQYYHFKNYVYNNISPRHIMMGQGSNYGKFYLVDLSKSNRYKESQFQEHVGEPVEQGWEMRLYNMEFSSINYQKGNIPTRRDDMESLLYLLAYLIYGELPWSNETRSMKKTEFEKWKYVAELKSSQGEALFKDHPDLQSLFNYTANLKFQEKPQYAYFASTFKTVMEKKGMVDDRMFDWMLLEEEEMEGLEHRLQVYEGEEEMVRGAGQQTVPPRQQSKAVRTNSKLPAVVTGSKNKSDKECLIY